MLFSVVILSYNSSRTLEQCLASLTEALSVTAPEDGSEVFVVDNGSKDHSRSIIERYKERYPNRIKPILFEENTGTTVSRNTALKKATGRYVLVLDSDAYIDTQALSTLRERLDSDGSIGMVVPQLAYGDGRFQMSTDTFPTLKRKIQRFLSLEKIQSSVTTEELKEQDVDYAISACWLIRRDAVDAVGGFDENIFYSPEDVDYCMQIWQSGFRIRYYPGARVVHDAQELSRGFKLSSFHISHLKGLFYLFKKYGYFFGLKRLYKKLGRH